MKLTHITCLIALWFVASPMLKGQDSICTDKKHKIINLAVWNKLSTNGEDTKCTSNNFSFSLGWSQAIKVDGMIVNILGYNVKDKVNGIGFAGIGSEVGTVNGISIGGLGSISTVANGLQIGGLFNKTEYLHGLQIGFATAVIGNDSINTHMHGVQIGAFNASRMSKGVQIGVNNSSHITKGVQIGFVNMSTKTRGSQVGFFNQSESAHGMQLGFINQTKEIKGIQMGVVNIVDNNKYPIGIVNIVKNGGSKAIALTYDEMNNMVASFRSGGKVTYGIAGLGVNLDSPHNHLVFEAGIGAHINLFSKFRIDTELVSDLLFKPGKPTFEHDNKKKEKKRHSSKGLEKYSFRVLPSIQVHRNIRIFGGASINYSHTRYEENTQMFSSKHLWRKYNTKSFEQLNLGWLAGAEYVF